MFTWKLTVNWFFAHEWETGASAKLFVETKNRKQVATLTLDLNIESSTDISRSTRIKGEKSSKTKPRKSPSTLKRDSKRLQEFRAKMNTIIPTSASTPKYLKTNQKPDFMEPRPVLCCMLKVQACDISDKSGDDFNFVSKPKSAKSEIKLSNKSPNKASTLCPRCKKR